MLDFEKRQEERPPVAPTPGKRRKPLRILLDTDRVEGPGLPFGDTEKPQARIGLAATVARPKCRAECAGLARPCHHVSCSHNLYLREDPRTGELRPRFPGKKLKDLKHSCALDVLEKADSLGADEIKDLLGCSQEELERIHERALLKIK